MKKQTCCFCGALAEGFLFNKWVKPTFTDHDKLIAGTIVCEDCAFWFQEQSVELAEKMEKDKPQRMRNYSHFVKSKEWKPFSKAQKSEMLAELVSFPFPELAVVAESGQKHIAFRARRNLPESTSGWVQFEENSVWVEPLRLQKTVNVIEKLLCGFGKNQVDSGNYYPQLVMKFGFDAWQKLEAQISKMRGTPFFQLAVFLAPMPEKTTETEGLPKTIFEKPAAKKQLALF
jgi:hypothetical protein